MIHHIPIALCCIYFVQKNYILDNISNTKCDIKSKNLAGLCFRMVLFINILSIGIKLHDYKTNIFVTHDKICIT